MEDAQAQSTALERILPELSVHEAHCKPDWSGVQPLQLSVAEFACRGHLPVQGDSFHVVARVDGSSLLLVRPDTGEHLFHLQLFFAHVALAEQDDVTTGRPIIMLQSVEVASMKHEGHPTFSLGNIELELHSSTSQYVCRQCMQRGLNGVRWSCADKKAHNVCLSCAPLQEPAETWLFVVDGDRSDAQALISKMSVAGAIQENPQAEYHIQVEPCGVGSNATVHLAERHESTHDLAAVKFAIKIFSSQRHDTFEKEMNALRAELSTLITVQTHPHIVHFYSVYRMDVSSFRRDAPHGSHDNACPFGWSVVMEHCSGGDLFDAVAKKRFSEDRSRIIMVGLLSALSHIHERGIVHRDVKPENVLLAEDDRAVLTDFGIACRVSDKDAMAKKCGSPGYVAPEVLCGKASSICIDSFSAGSLLHFLIAGKIPFHGSSVPSILSKTLRCELDLKKNPYMNQATQRCKDLVAVLLFKKYKQRPTAKLALSHPWILNVIEPDCPSDEVSPNVEDNCAHRMPARPPGKFFRQASPPDTAFFESLLTAAQNRPPGKFFGQRPGPHAAGPTGQSMSTAAQNTSDVAISFAKQASPGTDDTPDLLDDVSRDSFSRDTLTSNITDGLTMNNISSLNSSMLRQELYKLPPSCFSMDSRSNSKDEVSSSGKWSASVSMDASGSSCFRGRTDSIRGSASICSGDTFCSAAPESHGELFGAESVSESPYSSKAFGSVGMPFFAKGPLSRAEGKCFFPDRSPPRVLSNHPVTGGTHDSTPGRSAASELTGSQVSLQTRAPAGEGS